MVLLPTRHSRQPVNEAGDFPDTNRIFLKDDSALSLQFQHDTAWCGHAVVTLISLPRGGAQPASRRRNDEEI
jgi:hypothetical protein